MNRSFLIIFIPAVIVAAMYISLGIYPPRRIEVGIALVAAGLGAYRIRALMTKRGKSDRPAAPPAAPAALPGTPQK